MNQGVFRQHFASCDCINPRRVFTSLRVVPLHGAGVPHPGDAQLDLAVLKDADGAGRLAHDNRERARHIRDRGGGSMPGSEAFRERQAGCGGVNDSAGGLDRAVARNHERAVHLGDLLDRLTDAAVAEVAPALGVAAERIKAQGARPRGTRRKSPTTMSVPTALPSRPSRPISIDKSTTALSVSSGTEVLSAFRSRDESRSSCSPSRTTVHVSSASASKPEYTRTTWLPADK